MPRLSLWLRFPLLRFNGEVLVFSTLTNKQTSGIPDELAYVFRRRVRNNNLAIVTFQSINHKKLNTNCDIYCKRCNVHYLSILRDSFKFINT